MQTSKDHKHSINPVLTGVRHAPLITQDSWQFIWFCQPSCKLFLHSPVLTFEYLDHPRSSTYFPLSYLTGYQAHLPWKSTILIWSIARRDRREENIVLHPFWKSAYWRISGQDWCRREKYDNSAMLSQTSIFIAIKTELWLLFVFTCYKKIKT